MTREMTLMSKAGFKRDLADRHLAFEKEALCAFDSATDQVLMRRHADSFAEEALEVRDTQTGDRCDLTERQFLIQMVFNKGKHLSESATRHSPGHCLRFYRGRTVTTHQPRSDRYRQAIKIQSPRRISAFHLRFEGPSDALQLRI